MSELFGIDESQIRMWLCHKKVVSATETINVPLNITQVMNYEKLATDMNIDRVLTMFLHLQAYFARDALCKHIYSRLFDWIVHELNKSLVSTSSKKKFIGVLDIYGFVSDKTLF